MSELSPYNIAHNHRNPEILHGVGVGFLQRWMWRVHNIRRLDSFQEGEQGFDVALCQVISVRFGQGIQTVGGEGGGGFDMVVKSPSSEGVVEVLDSWKEQAEAVVLVSAA